VDYEDVKQKRTQTHTHPITTRRTSPADDSGVPVRWACKARKSRLNRGYDRFSGARGDPLNAAITAAGA
jgi:hypothetical protein